MAVTIFNCSLFIRWRWALKNSYIKRIPIQLAHFIWISECRIIVIRLHSFSENWFQFGYFGCEFYYFQWKPWERDEQFVKVNLGSTKNAEMIGQWVDWFSTHPINKTKKQNDFFPMQPKTNKKELLNQKTAFHEYRNERKKVNRGKKKNTNTNNWNAINFH